MLRRGRPPPWRGGSHCRSMPDRRVAHLIDTGGPGGAETIFIQLVRGLPSRGWGPVTVVPEPGWLRDRLESAGLDNVLVESQRSFDVPYLYRLVRLFRRTGVDVVQTHLLGSAVYGGVAAAVCGLPVVSTFHGTVDIVPTSVLSRAKLRLVDRLGSRLVFVSETLRRHVLETTPIARDRTVVIQNGIDVDQYRIQGDGAFRSELGLGEEEILVGAVGNVRPAKNYELLLKVAERLHRRDPRYRFVVVGERGNDLARRLERTRTARDLEGVVHFLGLRDDIPRVLAALDLYLLTSSSEGFSLSTVEAMASGLPPVATRCGGPEEIIEDGVDGRLVDAGSPEALAGAIEELVGAPERVRKMGRAARRKAKREFSLEKMMAKYAELYEERTA